MAEVGAELPRLANGAPDVDLWLDGACGVGTESRKTARLVLDLIPQGEARALGLELFELLWQLKMDVVTVTAGLCLFAAQRGDLDVDALPADVSKLVSAALRLAAVDVLAFDDSAVLASESKSQAENVRHLLIALIDDPRVAVAKLAERVIALRHAANGDRAARHVAAREAMQFFAPLAGRLGIWQLKWSLEDLAFHQLYPQDYKKIVANLDSRRDARERQVEAIRQDLEFRLSAAGIDGEVQGRAKHIYSIWKKMSHKAIEFSQVHDVQAARVLVESVNDCYRVLGLVHTSWPPIASEFDDYIANPKENGYRSIHTAVVGPAGKVLEVQIRTREMHEEAELGVCAHWAYKEEPSAARERTAREDSLRSQKMDWLRSVLEWYDQRLGAPGGAYSAVATAENVFASEQRIYVTTPQGHVLDLAANATPVDFAYRVHTEIGHRCRGARVDGRPVSLNRRLATGECVEIETTEAAEPLREWLNPELGYVNTSRARSKVQSWFRAQLAESNIRAGRTLLEESLARLDLPLPQANGAATSAERFETMAKRTGYASEDDMFLAVGVGDALVIDLVKARAEDLGDVLPEAPEEGPGAIERLTVQGRDRDGLLRDVMSAIAAASIPVVAAQARADVPGESATITIDMHVAAGAEDRQRLAQALADIRQVDGVAVVSPATDQVA